ncbi:MAG TPA: TolC family protein [Polyangiaceae bacterium]|nr:TolC family protein [Polyangiaceae bacterium]
MRELAGSMAALVLGTAALGCVSADASYADVRRLVSERTGKDVRWQARESEPRDGPARELLAKPLTADAAVQVALLDNAEVQAAFEDLGVARSRLVQRLRLPNPSVEAALRFEGSRRPEVDLFGLLSVTDLALLPVENGAGQARLAAAQLSVAGQVLDLAFATRVAFYELQAAQQVLELDRNIALALAATVEAAEALHTAGNITDLRLSSEQALYGEAQLAATRAEALLTARREELASLLGISGTELHWSAEPRLASPSSASALPNDLEARAVERSLDLQLLRTRATAASREANLATVRGWVPELRAGVSAERKNDVDPAWGVGPAVSLEVPLFYQGQGERGAALADLRRQQQREISTAARIRARARAVGARLRAARDSVGYYERVLLPLRQKILDDTQLEYNAMSVGVFQLLEAKRAQIEAARGYVQLLREFWTVRAEADQLLAGRLPGQSSAPSEAGEDGAVR